MYESPLDKIYGEIKSQMVKQDEENFMYAVKQTVGYTVDRDALVKALQYDRDQYEKGYSDAQKDIATMPAIVRFKQLFDELGINYTVAGDMICIDTIEVNGGEKEICIQFSTEPSGKFSEFIVYDKECVEWKLMMKKHEKSL